jgi:hypothetical protein
MFHEFVSSGRIGWIPPPMLYIHYKYQDQYILIVYVRGYYYQITLLPACAPRNEQGVESRQ